MKQVSDRWQFSEKVASACSIERLRRLRQSGWRQCLCAATAGLRHHYSFGDTGLGDDRSRHRLLGERHRLVLACRRSACAVRLVHLLVRILVALEVLPHLLTLAAQPATAAATAEAATKAPEAAACQEAQHDKQRLQRREGKLKKILEINKKLDVTLTPTQRLPQALRNVSERGSSPIRSATSAPR